MSVVDHSAAPPRRYARRFAWLEELHARFHHPQFITTDPLQVLYRYDDAAEREIVGLIAASLAYGNVKAIMRGIDAALGRMQPSPRQYLIDTTPSGVRRDFADFRYRVTSGGEMASLLCGVRSVLLDHGSLEASFADHDSEDDTILPALGGFVGAICDGAGCDLPHLLPNPDRGSACKRLMLYLRWMVRCDAIDPGGWTRIAPRKLIIPLDTHMHAMAIRLRLTRRRNASLRTAVEITEGFRAMCPTDPLRYDFSLTRPGIMKLPATNLVS